MYGDLNCRQGGLTKSCEKGNGELTAKAILKGRLGNKKAAIYHEIHFTFPREGDQAEVNGGSIHRLAAKQLIQEKQDAYNNRSRTWSDEKEDAFKHTVIFISKATNIVSKFTSFVAVDKESHQPVSEPLQRQVVPSSDRLNAVVGNVVCRKSCGLAAGDVVLSIAMKRERFASGSLRRKSSRLSRPADAEEKASVKKSIGSFSSKLFSGASLSRPKGKDQGQSSNAACALEEAERDNISKQEKEPEGDAPALLSVILLQKASGAWDLTDRLVSLCGKSKDSLITGCPAAIVVDTSEGKLLWATALALVLLMGKFGNKKDEWEMVEEKGKKWMKKNLPAAIKYDEVITFAAATVGVQIS